MFSMGSFDHLIGFAFEEGNSFKRSGSSGGFDFLRQGLSAFSHFAFICEWFRFFCNLAGAPQPFSLGEHTTVPTTPVADTIGVGSHRFDTNKVGLILFNMTKVIQTSPRVQSSGSKPVVEPIKCPIDAAKTHEFAGLSYFVCDESSSCLQRMWSTAEPTKTAFYSSVALFYIDGLYLLSSMFWLNVAM